MEKETEELKKKQVYTFEILLEKCMTNNAATLDPDTPKLLNLAALISPSSTKVKMIVKVNLACKIGVHLLKETIFEWNTQSLYEDL